MQLGTADAYIFCQFLNVEVRVGEVLVHIFHHSFHESVVIALYLYLLNLSLLSLRTAVFATDASDIIYQIVDENMKLFHIERFSQKGIGTFAQSL